MSPSRFLNMGHITFLDLKYHFPSSLKSILAEFLFISGLSDYTVTKVETLLRMHPVDNCCPVIQNWA